MLQFLAMSGRAGGAYCFVFGHPDAERHMEFFGKYVEVTPHSRLVWTSDEGDEAASPRRPSRSEARRPWSSLHRLGS